MPHDYGKIHDLNRREHFVYQLLGRRGRVLYIGCTMDLLRRMREHKVNLLLGPKIGRVEAEGPYNFADARRIERELIERHEPEFNTQHTSRRPARYGRGSVA